MKYTKRILAALCALLLSSCASLESLAQKSTVAFKGEAWTAGFSNGGLFGVYDFTAKAAARTDKTDKTSGKRVVPAK